MDSGGEAASQKQNDLYKAKSFKKIGKKIKNIMKNCPNTQIKDEEEHCHEVSNFYKNF